MIWNQSSSGLAHYAPDNILDGGRDAPRPSIPKTIWMFAIGGAVVIGTALGFVLSR